MIPCSKCGKSFVFGVIREMEMPIIEVGKRVEELRGIELEPNEMLAWAESMAETFASFDVGDIVVCLDGTYLRFDSTDIEFDGYFAHHELERLPHAEALENSTRLEAILGNKKYWFDRELPDRERD